MYFSSSSEIPCFDLNVSHSIDVFCIVDTLDGPSSAAVNVSRALLGAAAEEEEEDEDDKEEDEELLWPIGTMRSISVMSLPNLTVSLTVSVLVAAIAFLAA